MLLSTQTDVTARDFGLAEAVRMIAAAGFDAADISMFDDDWNQWMFSDGFEAPVADVKRAAKESGIVLNQAHAPFPTMKDGDAAFNEKRFAQVKRAIEIAGMLGVRNIIVHPVVFQRQMKKKNLDMYRELEPIARKAGVRIALENMWGWDNRRNIICKNVCSDAQGLADYVDALDPDVFTVCLDIGHVGLVGDYEAKTIRQLGAKRLTCLHVHDTDYRNDLHTLPYCGRLPWQEIMAALGEIGYTGDLTFEADNFIKTLPKTLIPSALRYMHDVGRELIRMTHSS
ncbi:MAG: sugar phosphate isomerase/epimerase [Clostridia bacterium]|nr:sugar phosphate isomerase/epimerase [Clostridia bacterium]